MDTPDPKQSRRGDLLRIARVEFAKRGFADVSVEDLSAMSGMKKSTFFHHFASKEQLYDEVVQGILRELTASLADHGEHGAVFSPKLDETIWRMIAFFDHLPQAAPLILRAVADVQTERMSARTKTALGEVVDALSKILERGMEEGAVSRDEDMRQLAWGMLAITCASFTAGGIANVDGHDADAVEARQRRLAAASRHVGRLLKGS